MKRAIHCLFATAVLAAALQPVVARAESKWVFVIVAFVSGSPVESKVYGADSKVMCEKARAEARTQLVNTTEVQFGVGECSPVVVPEVPKPKADANT